MEVHFKSDPVVLTFTNPISAYHALAPFQEWVAGEGAKYKITNVVGPGAPIERTSTFGLGGFLTWNDIYTPTGQIGHLNPEQTLIYEDRKTITCKYRIKGMMSGQVFNNQARAIIKENKKRQGFTMFEAWQEAVQVEDGIPLAWGSAAQQSLRMYWTPGLETEWGL